ncbi:DNA topoisomerase 1 [Dipsacomyces acuminosporus]|nr:DNA topoisomerase 1 [Dipsacomyces acuminosporus]
MSSSDSDDGIPLSARVANGKGSGADDMPLSRRPYTAQDDSSGSESDQPLSKKVKTANGSAKAVSEKKPARSKPAKERKQKEADPPKPRAGAKAKEAKKPATEKKANRAIDRKPLIKAESSVAASSQDGSDAEDYKWWLEENKDDDGQRWQSLEHNGVMFPPPYSPHGVPLRYGGKSVGLAHEAEEVATFFAAVVGTDHGNNPTFQRNFFRDFKAILDKTQPKHCIKEFEHCDFSLIRAHLDEESAKRKALAKEEKEALKKGRQADVEKYGYCLIDGRREKVGNFRIEPPDLFRGRGAHPKTGMLKQRVLPEQVTINIGKDAKIPDPPPGHRWGNVVHDSTVTWLAMWKENVNNNTKYVFLAAGSSIKGQSDLRKFDKARNLKLCIDGIRQQYTKDLKNEVMSERQRATAMYLIDRFALRAGNEKGEDEADTVGCCSLRCEHVKLEAPDIVHFDFLGKDSIRYERTTQVDRQVWKNLRIFQKKPKAGSDMLFDRLNPTSLNKHLQKLMPGLTAKVFRTFNASFVFQQQLASTPADGTEAEKILAYNRANREVAVLCNHQRSVSKGFQGQMSKIEDRLLVVRYQRQQLKEHLRAIAPDLAKKHPEIAEDEPGVTSRWIKSHLLATCDLDREKAQKKFERENQKLQEAGEPLVPESKLEEQYAEIERRRESIMDGTYEPELPIGKNATTDKVLEKIEKLTARIGNIEVDKIEKDENKTTALSTSKINYIDPRISIAWCKKHDVPLEKIFNKALREKFNWAMDIDTDWTF